MSSATHLPTTTGAARTSALADVVRSARAELLRLRRWPALWTTLGVWLALNVSFGYLFPYFSFISGQTTVGEGDATHSELLLRMLPPASPEVLLHGAPMFGGALMLVLGALASGSGYPWGTWKTVFSHGVRRVPVVVGSLAALIAMVAATVGLTLAVDLGLASVISAVESQGLAMPSVGTLLESAGVGFGVLAMWALVGYLAGTLARGPALSVGLGLVWALVVENLLRGVGLTLGWVEALTQLLPGTAAGSLIGSIIGVPAGGGTPGVFEAVSGGQAALTVAAYAVLAAVATLVVVRRRDVE